MRFLWKSRRSPLLRSLAALQEHVGSVRAGESSPHTVAAAFHLVMRLMINAWILIYQMRIFFFPRGSNMNNRVCRAYICIHDTWREVDVGLLVEWVTHYPPPTETHVQIERGEEKSTWQGLCAGCLSSQRLHTESNGHLLYWRNHCELPREGGGHL